MVGIVGSHNTGPPGPKSGGGIGDGIAGPGCAMAIKTGPNKSAAMDITLVRLFFMISGISWCDDPCSGYNSLKLIRWSNKYPLHIKTVV